MLGGSWARPGALLLSDKDYPLFVGDFGFGFAAGLTTKIKLSSLVDFSFNPVFVQQEGFDEKLQALQIPMSLVLAVGDAVKLSADAGIFTGDDFTLRPSKGGRVTAGAAIDVKIGKIITHLGAGAASLFPGGMYPTLKDSFYIDLNVAFAK